LQKLIDKLLARGRENVVAEATKNKRSVGKTFKAR